jgi:hypothetical protein
MWDRDSQFFFMLDERVDRENNFELGKKLRAWINAQDRNSWFAHHKDITFEQQPLLNQNSTPGKGFLPEGEGLGFFHTQRSWVFNDNRSPYAWIINLMDFMDSQGLGDRYYFTKVPTMPVQGCQEIVERGFLEPVNQNISVEIDFTLAK